MFSLQDCFLNQFSENFKNVNQETAADVHAT